MTSAGPYYNYAPVPKKKRTGLIVGLVAGVLFLLACCGVGSFLLNSSDDIATGTVSPVEGSSVEGNPAASAKLNQPVRDGKFEFVVTKVECGKSRTGSSEFGQKAQGQFCFASLTVKNIADEPQTLFDSNQYAFNASGQKYKADGSAGMYIQDNEVLWTEINPGNQVKGTVVFDIPKGQTLTKLELHDSAFSGGVEVSVK